MLPLPIVGLKEMLSSSISIERSPKVSLRISLFLSKMLSFFTFRPSTKLLLFFKQFLSFNLVLIIFSTLPNVVRWFSAIDVKIKTSQNK